MDLGGGPFAGIDDGSLLAKEGLLTGIEGGPLAGTGGGPLLTIEGPLAG